jgi:hypothetical protein
MFYRAARDEYGIPPVTRLLNELFDALARCTMWEDALRILSDDVLSSTGSGDADLADETTIAHLVRALITAGELDQGVAALELGKFLTGSKLTRASERLEAALRRAKSKPQTSTPEPA